MKLVSLSHQETDEFLAQTTLAQFLQSRSWASFQRKIGNETWQIGVKDEQDNVLACAQVIEQKLPLGKSYLYCPRGPIVVDDLTVAVKIEALKLILSKIREITASTPEEEIFMRFEPRDNLPFLKTVCQEVNSTQPKHTWLINLNRPLEALLFNLHPKTKYNLGLAEKKGVTARQANMSDWPAVWQLLNNTSQRQEIRLHPENYYLEMLKTCPEVVIYLAEVENQPLACLISSWYGDTVTYLHGGSDYNSRQFMAPHLLHWKIINLARERGFAWYDFHGVANDDNPLDPWAGLTRFKKGFGGEQFNFAGTFDFIYQPLAYKIYQQVRQLNRRLKKYFHA